MCNRYGVKDIIFDTVSSNDKSIRASENELTANTISTERSSSVYGSPDCSNEQFFLISVLREDFKNLLTEKIYKRRIIEKGKTYYRLRTVLQPGKWQELITNKFWEATHMRNVVFNSKTTIFLRTQHLALLMVSLL